MAKIAHSISVDDFCQILQFCLLDYHRGLGFGLVGHNLNDVQCARCAPGVHYLGMKFARLHHKDLSSSLEGGYHFPRRGGDKFQD